MVCMVVDAFDGGRVIKNVVATFTPRRSDISGARFTRSPLLASRLPAGCRSALWYTNGSHT